MDRYSPAFAAACLTAFSAGLACASANAEELADPRLREMFYDPQAVISIPVKRGVVTDVALEPGEVVTDIATGLGSDCAKPESSWCIAAQAGGRHIFVKPKSIAGAPNNIAVITDQRTYSFQFVVLNDRDPRPPVYRLSIKAPPPPPAPPPPLPSEEPTVPPPLSPAEVIKGRLESAPVIVNSAYSVVEGKASQDIAPSLVFDDGRFTYLKFSGNRELPAVFQVLPDASETMVNTRMEGDLLVVDRVSRRLMLRAGNAVVGIFNDAFDLDGVPPEAGTTVPGVERAVKEPPPHVAPQGSPR